MKKLIYQLLDVLEEWDNKLSNLLKKQKDFKVVSVTENRIINKKISGLKPQLNSELAFKNTNIIIDFTIPKCTLEVLKLLRNKKSSHWNYWIF